MAPIHQVQKCQNAKRFFVFFPPFTPFLGALAPKGSPKPSESPVRVRASSALAGAAAAGETMRPPPRSTERGSKGRTGLVESLFGSAPMSGTFVGALWLAASQQNNKSLGNDSVDRLAGN